MNLFGDEWTYLLQAYLINKQKSGCHQTFVLLEKGINALFKRQLITQFVCYFVHISFESGISPLNSVTAFLFISDR
jgi:hypothetical protein